MSSDPLLASGGRTRSGDQNSAATLIRTSVWGGLTVLFVLGLILVAVLHDSLADWSWSGRLPKDPMLAAWSIMDIAPVIVRCFC
jgi:hypothetical protein